jgi:hypothetical protein
MNKRPERNLIVGAWALVAILVAIACALPYYAHSLHHPAESLARATAAQAQSEPNKLTVDDIVGSIEPPTDKARELKVENKLIIPDYEQHKLALRQAVETVRSTLDHPTDQSLKDFEAAVADAQALEKQYVSKRREGANADTLRGIADSYVKIGATVDSDFASLVANRTAWQPFQGYWNSAENLKRDLNWLELNGDGHKDELKTLTASISDWDAEIQTYIDAHDMLTIVEEELKAKYNIPDNQPLPTEIRQSALLRRAVSHLEALDHS